VNCDYIEVALQMALLNTRVTWGQLLPADTKAGRWVRVQGVHYCSFPEQQTTDILLLFKTLRIKLRLL
jgi:hypothetical protein